MFQVKPGTNTLYYDLECPYCKVPIRSGIGFRVGSIKQLSYRLGEKLKWDGPITRPKARPAGGNMQTIGYFNCDNPRCDTWKDCFPEVQEALIVIREDYLAEVKVVEHNPGSHNFEIVEPAGIE